MCMSYIYLHIYTGLTYLVCTTGSVDAEHPFLVDCPAYSHIRQQYSHLFQHSSSVTAFLATGERSVENS